MKLEDVASLKAGLNSSIIKRKGQADNQYQSDDLGDDLFLGTPAKKNSADTEKRLVQEGDLVVNLNRTNNPAAIVSAKNAGKIVSQRIVQIDWDEEKVDPWYLCYVLNESTTIKRQIYVIRDSTTILNVGVRYLNSLKLKLPALDQQRQIGESYRQLLIALRLQKERIEEVKKTTISLLRKVDKNG